MSIIVNEIHVLDGFCKTTLVFAADRRITKLDGSYDSQRRKLFRIPYLEAGISYFGLAGFHSGGRNYYFSEWIPSFVRRHADTTDLRTFALKLHRELNRTIASTVLEKHSSGFHIGGYNSKGIPEFWFITNIGGMQGFDYTNLQRKYAEPSSDFLERDAIKHGWDGQNPRSIRNMIFTYRNGDYRGHVYGWELLEGFLNGMRQFPDFKLLNALKNPGEMVRFKLEVIAYLYKRFAQRKIIGRPIDVFSLSKSLS